jgi:hypothetical protein
MPALMGIASLHPSYEICPEKSTGGQVSFVRRDDAYKVGK